MHEAAKVSVVLPQPGRLPCNISLFYIQRSSLQDACPYPCCQLLNCGGLARACLSHQQHRLLLLHCQSHRLQQAHGVTRLCKAGAQRSLQAARRLNSVARPTVTCSCCKSVRAPSLGMPAGAWGFQAQHTSSPDPRAGPAPGRPASICMSEACSA